MGYGMGSVTSGGMEYPIVETFADLPAANLVPLRVFLVSTPTGVWMINRKAAGLYRSDGTSWVRMGVLPSPDEPGLGAALKPLIAMGGIDGQPPQLPDPGDHNCIECGHSESETAKSGVAVAFNRSFNNPPRISLCVFQKDLVYVDSETVTVDGFTWYSDEEDSSKVDWIAVGTQEQ